MRHPVRVTALPGNTPTSPVIVESVHVTAVPARTAKVDVEPVGCCADAAGPVVAISARAAAAQSRPGRGRHIFFMSPTVPQRFPCGTSHMEHIEGHEVKVPLSASEIVSIVLGQARLEPLQEVKHAIHS